MVSYLKNTDKLKELFIESRDPQAMRAMFDITFKGRRFSSCGQLFYVFLAMFIVCCDFRLLVLVCEANVIRSINTNLNLKNKFN